MVRLWKIALRMVRYMLIVSAICSMLLGLDVIMTHQPSSDKFLDPDDLRLDSLIPASAPSYRNRSIIRMSETIRSEERHEKTKKSEERHEKTKTSEVTSVSPREEFNTLPTIMKRVHGNISLGRIDFDRALKAIPNILAKTPTPSSNQIKRPLREDQKEKRRKVAIEKSLVQFLISLKGNPGKLKETQFIQQKRTTRKKSQSKDNRNIEASKHLPHALSVEYVNLQHQSGITRIILRKKFRHRINYRFT